MEVLHVFNVVIAILFFIFIAKLIFDKVIPKYDKMKRCLMCGYEGEMKTWLSNYGLPQFLVIVLLLCYLIPGLIFIAWGWGKYKCPQCGALAKNVDIIHVDATQGDLKKCPFCAEIIKQDAIKCKHCASDLSKI